MVLMEGYRIANDSQRLIMLATADAVIKQSEDDAREKKEVI
jgi:hypothetical protein